jgi:hypothetical protein
MSGRKHLMVIHGRSTKPSEQEKRRLVKKCLVHGLNRVDPKAASRLGPGDVKFTFVYYGDIANALILDRNPDRKKRLTGVDAKHGNAVCEPDGFYDHGIDLLFGQTQHGKAAYKAFLKKYPDQRWLDDASSVVSYLAGLTGLSDNIIKPVTADMGAYLMTRQFGSAIRERLQAPLKKALIAGDDVCLVAHSMGCIVAYDVLWKFSRMSEYRAVQNASNPVSLWLTLGNPLGEPGVRDNLYDADEHEDGVYPTGIIRDWENISAEDDFICHDPTISDDFKAMKRDGHLKSMKDTKIYNFWMGAENTNPHKFYGYLDNPTVARRIVRWMNA